MRCMYYGIVPLEARALRALGHRCKFCLRDAGRRRHPQAAGARAGHSIDRVLVQLHVVQWCACGDQSVPGRGPPARIRRRGSGRRLLGRARGMQSCSGQHSFGMVLVAFALHVRRWCACGARALRDHVGHRHEFTGGILNKLPQKCDGQAHFLSPPQGHRISLHMHTRRQSLTRIAAFHQVNHMYTKLIKRHTSAQNQVDSTTLHDHIETPNQRDRACS